MEKVVLYHWDLIGMSDPIRMTLFLGNIEYEDHRIKFEEFQALKQQKRFKFYQLPIIEINGQQYAQQSAILQFLARTIGIAPKDSIGLLKQEEALQLFNDFMQDMMPVWEAEGTENHSQVQKDMTEKVGVLYFNYLENLLKKNGSNGWLVGNSLTVADLIWSQFQELIHNFLSIKDKSYFDQFPLIKLHDEKVANHEGVKRYFEQKLKK